MSESFYTYLHGPRTFWGSGSRTVINNNFFGMPMFPPFRGMCATPMFGCNSLFGNSFNYGCNCNSGMNDLFGFMMLNSMINGKQGDGLFNFGGLSNIYNPFGGYNQNKTNSTLSTKVKSLEDQLAEAKKEIKDLKTEKEKNKKTNAEETERKNRPAKPIDTSKLKKQSVAPSNDGGAVKTVEDSNKKATAPKTLDEQLNTINGFEKLTSEQQKYVKDKVKAQHVDDKGNVTYDINAITHSGDTLNAIVNRFYQSDEEHNQINVPEFNYNAQTSGKKVKYPGVGEDITLNNVSNFGMTSLMKDASNNITKEGETQKTGLAMQQAKDNFKSGKQKLSEEYVLQNHMMTKKEYDKIINEKYSK